MTNSTFIKSLCLLLIAVAVFVVWTLNSAPSTASSSKSEHWKLNTENSRHSGVASHSSVHTPHSRFTSLTDKTIRWQLRVDQLRRLDASTLNATEIDYLYSLLRNQPDTNKEAWWVVMNEVMEQIVKQQITPERITTEFTSIIADPTLDPVIRDYAIQHISTHLATSPTAPSTTAPSTQPSHSSLHTSHSKVHTSHSKVLKTLVASIKEANNQHNSIPGTAFMGLIEVSTNPDHKQKVSEAFEQLESYLTPLISGESSASLANRTSAINAVGLIQAEQYLPILQELVTTEETNDSVKLSSIAALGDYFSPSTQPSHSSLHTSHSPSGRDSVSLLLLGISKGDTKFKHAATAALKKFQN